jgi:uncharacterized protein (DUF924 family)
MTPREVLDFWFDPANQPFWFKKSAAFDEAVRHRLGDAHAAAAAGRLDDWRATPEGALALVILLDQVPRNIHRGTARAFATDDAALAVAAAAIDDGFDRGLDKDQRLFLYLPLEHSEKLADQERSVALFTELGDARLTDYAVRHRDIVARFGRFPHRNALLGRASTEEEISFLEGPNSSF